MNTPITLATLSSATAQQVFDQVAVHMLTQKQQSLSYSNGVERCVYRGRNGLKCAAGALIADEEYRPCMENKGWDELVFYGTVPADHQFLIARLQEIHDTATWPKSWYEELSNLATSLGLNADAIAPFAAEYKA